MIPNDKCGYEEFFYDPTKNVYVSVQHTLLQLNAAYCTFDDDVV